MTSKAANRNQDGQHEVDSEQSTKEHDQMVGAHHLRQQDLSSEFGNFISRPGDGDQDSEASENELENELWDPHDRRWDLRKDRTGSESVSGSENAEDEQKDVSPKDEQYQESWQKAQEEWRKEAEEEED